HFRPERKIKGSHARVQAFLTGARVWTTPTGRGETMPKRFTQIAVFWLLLLATFFVAEPYLVSWRFSATAPQTITPRENLTEAEQARIKLFQTVSPSVVYVFARARPEELFGRGEEVSDVQAGTGIIWDAAGHVITNYHVIKGADQFAAHLQTGE